jgi:hypothetical protein
MWDFFEPEDNQWYRWDLNGASAFLQKKDDSWQVLFNQIMFRDLEKTIGGPFPSESPVPKETDFSFVVGKGKKAALRPYLSGMPYLVTIQDDIKIMPGAEMYFDVMLPPLLRFELSPNAILAEQMPFILSRTWFGDNMAGTLCHSLPTILIPRCDENSINHQCLIHCKLLFRNTSKILMDLKQTAIYTDMLNVYEKDGHLVTDEVILDSLNDGNLKMSIHHYGQNKGYKKISRSINGGKSEMFVRRGVEFIKTMTSI